MMKKRFFVLILLVVMIVSGFNDLSAQDIPALSVPYHINPVYQDYVKGERPSSGQLRKGPSKRSVEEVPFAATEAEIAAYLRAGLAAHKSEVKISFLHDIMDQDFFDAFYDRIEAAALTHTGVPNEGDYIVYNYEGSWAEIEGEYSEENDAVLYTITFHADYLYDEALEAEASAAFDQAYAEIKPQDTSAAGITRAVYDYVIGHVSYDEENLEDDTYTLKHSAYAAIINHTAVCQGYAAMVYRLLLMFGIDNRIVYSEEHAWNIVNIEGRFYQLDATWGDSEYEDVRDMFFLRGAGAWDDIDDTHQFSAEFLTDEFTDRYPISNSDYAPDAVLVTAVIADGDGTAYGDALNVDFSADEITLFAVIGPDGTEQSAIWSAKENDPVTLEPSADGMQCRVVFTGYGNAVITMKSAADPEAFDKITLQRSPFEILDGVLTAYYGTDPVVVIPDGVTEIAGEVFLGNTTITSVTMPEGLTKINDRAFMRCTNLKTVNFPDTLTYIGHDGFGFCINLTSIKIPDSVTSMGQGVFEMCSLLQNVKYPKGLTYINDGTFYHCTSLQTFDFSSSVKYIRSQAFQGCTGLTSLVLPENLRTVGDKAFEGCTNLTSVTLQDINYSSTSSIAFDYDTVVFSVQETAVYDGQTYTSRPLYWLRQLIESGQYVRFRIIGQEGDWTIVGGTLYAYLGTMAAVELPLNVIEVYSGAFYFSNVKDITIQNTGILISDNAIPEGTVIRSFENSAAEEWAEKNGYDFEPLISDVQWNVDEETGIMTISGIGVYEADFYTELPWYKYMWNNPVVTTIEFGEKITQIGPYYFEAFGGLTDVRIPEGIVSIGNFAFYRCDNLVNIEIPDSVTTIGNYAFGSCEKLDHVVVPASVISIAENAFDGTLPWIYAGTPAYDWAVTNNKAFHLIGDDDFTIIDGVLYSYVGTDADVTIPDSYAGESVTGIAENVFADNTHISTVTIPDTVTVIGDNVFKNCSGLKKVTLPAGLTSIPAYAFSNCSLLSDLHIPDTVTFIGEKAFQYCTSLTSINIPADMTEISARAFFSSGLSQITIPDNITSISNDAFANSTSLRTVVIPDSVESIAYGVFTNCMSLSDITFTGNRKEIPVFVFADSGLKSYDIPDGFETIGKGAFENCQYLSSVSIPDSVTAIGSLAFAMCPSLTSITIPAAVKEIAADTFENSNTVLLVYSEDDYAAEWARTYNHPYQVIGTNDFVIDENGVLTAYNGTDAVIRIPDGVTEIGAEVFSQNKIITSVTMPEGLKKISRSAFLECTNLAEVNFPSTLTLIEGYAFKSCPNLVKVDFPSGLTTIYGYAFQYCHNLAEVSFPDTLTYIGYDAFCYCTGLTSVEIPDSVTYMGAGAFERCENMQSIKLSKNLEYIDSGSFYMDMKLESIEIPESVTKINQQAFQGCESLQSVVILESVSSVSIKAFDLCTNLTSVTLPDDLNDIAEDAFDFTRVVFSVNPPTYENGAAKAGPALEWLLDRNRAGAGARIRLIGETEDWTVVSSCLYSYLGTETAVVVPDSVETIGSSAFAGRENLNSVILPDNLTSIESYSFAGCSSLANITIPASVKEIAANAFDNSETVLYVYSEDDYAAEWARTNNHPYQLIYSEFEVEDDVLVTYNGNEEKVTIPENVTEIGEGVFINNLTIRSVSLPKYLKKIGPNAFTGCSGLTEITIPDSVEEIAKDAIPESTVITANAGSFAAAWAQENGYTLKLIVTVTFKVTNGSWDGDTASVDDIIIKLTGPVGSDDLKLTDEQIPGVGTKPKEGFKEGSWDAVPDTETVITENTVYTYAFAASSVPGDLSGDGVVNLKDVLLLRNYFLKNGVGVTIFGNPDTSGDGTVNLKDVLLLRNYFLKNGIGVVIY